MKQILIFLFLCLTVLSMKVGAGEVTGAGGPMMKMLAKHGYSKEFMQAHGFKVILGEVTGAGRTLPTEDIEAFLTSDAVLNSQDIVRFDFKNPSLGKSFKDISSVEFVQHVVFKKDIRGVVFK
ncbi:hypothetical protein A9Q84_15525 [Halobacteriovorax marinus]|uniref:Uncharacterized protein n=1 Tax=Halobacteriovorax marinus TaxID=97084 RepID=A0A1Y5F7S3_9BACT|nr:hypothetical protein A9Q84_15525 [Halobacteriovorax marinus]